MAAGDETPKQTNGGDWKPVLGSLGSDTDSGAASSTFARGGGGGIILGDVKNDSVGTLTTQLELSSINDEIILRLLPLALRTAVVVALGSGPPTG